MSRRQLMRRAGAIVATGLGAAAATTVLGAGTARGGAGDLKLGQNGNAASAPTGLAVSQSSAAGVYGLGVTDRGLGAFPESASMAAHAGTTYDFAVLGFHDHAGTGVLGYGLGGGSVGVEGRSEGRPGIGVHGSNDADGYGVAGYSARGAGVVGASGGIGVRGSGLRGGVFEGKKAQLQLIPGAASSHPTPGKRGDFYLDKGGRLWFCKKGGSRATWTSIA